MFGQIVAFFAIATTVAFASTCGYCYPGYGGYCGSSVFGSGVYNQGLYGSRILRSGFATPTFTAAVGAPEIVSSCENTISSPLLSTGFVSSGLYRSGCYGNGLGYGYGSTLGGCGCGSSVVATTC